MKTNKLIGILLFFVLSVSGYASASYGISPSTSNVGDRVKVYTTLSADLPSGYDIRVSSSSSSSASAFKLGHGPRYWYTYSTVSKSGTFKLYFKLFFF